MVKKTWNNEWAVVSKTDGVSLVELKDVNEQKLTWKGRTMKELDVVFSVINDANINKITIKDKDAVILNTDYKSIWYYFDIAGSLFSEHYHDYDKPDFGIKALDKAGSLIFNFNPEK